MSLIDLIKKLWKRSSEMFLQLYSDNICQFSGGNSRMENFWLWCAAELSRSDMPSYASNLNWKYILRKICALLLHFSLNGAAPAATGNSEPSVRLTCVCLDRGRKLEDLWRTTQTPREHAASTQKGPGPGNQTCGCSAVRLQLKKQTKQKQY